MSALPCPLVWRIILKTMKRVLSFAAAIIAAAPMAVFAGSAPALATVSKSGPWTIHSYMDRPSPADHVSDVRCVEVQGASTAQSAQVQMFDCKPQSNHQRWDFQYDSYLKTYRII